MHGRIDRRGFLGVGGAALLCTIGGKRVRVHTAEDVKPADGFAASLKRPAAARHDPVDSLKFGTPEPQPGGQVREYWIQARAVRWDIAPTGRDDWMGMRLPPHRKRTFWAYAYQPFSPGFANPLGPPSIPGPTLQATVGDVIVAHVRNADEHFGQAVTMHPHGVRYTPDYDGAYLGDYTRAGGFIAPGAEFKYTWECTPDTVG